MTPAEIRAHLPLVRGIAKRHRCVNGAFDVDDLVQVGLLGLLHAHRLYDPTRGMSFRNYARRWIRSYVTYERLSSEDTVRTPPNAKYRLRRAGLPDHVPTRSLDAPLANDTEATGHDVTPAPAVDPGAAGELAELVARSRLIPREHYVLHQHLTGRTYDEVARELGISRQAASQTAERAVAKLHRTGRGRAA